MVNLAWHIFTHSLSLSGISATYEMKSGRLDISSTESDTSNLCIHAEYHVGGLRNMNETCLLPGQTVYIRNGAREHQLWLVVCGRGVCSASSRVEYLDNSDERWSMYSNLSDNQSKIRFVEIWTTL